MTLSIRVFSKMPLNVTAFSITTLCEITFSLGTLNNDTNFNDVKQNDT